MKRRQIIQSIAATATLSIPAVVWWTSHRNALDDGTGFDIQDVFLDKDQVRELGTAYRTRYPEEDDDTLLRTLIAPSGASTQLDKSVLQDFDSGNTVQLNGWILSRTEAGRYALFSLLVD